MPYSPHEKLKKLNTSFTFSWVKTFFRKSPHWYFIFLNSPLVHTKEPSTIFHNKIFHICAHLQKRDVWFSFFVTYIEKNQKRDFASFEWAQMKKVVVGKGGWAKKKNEYNRPPAKDSVAKTTLRGEWNCSWFPLQVSKYIVSKIHPNRYILFDRLICFQDNIFQRSKQIIIQFQLK